ncbi:MAG TPA: CBS domain-containing protein, partial [Saprospiraceae bacterium]|nr:CBS domain-containing protein [Saprospiraceae bacterium]
QLPIFENDQLKGSITQSKVLDIILANPLINSDKSVGAYMDLPFPMVQMDMPIKELNRYITKTSQAVLVKDNSGALYIITQYDIIQAL